MTKYREILRLKSLEFSQQNIADSCNVSKKTVNRVLKRAKELGDFDMIGVSVHSKEEALDAVRLGATYLIAGNVFETDCKKGLSGKGVDFLKEICENSSVPVYGIGGINDENTKMVQETGAMGECRMSYYMKL